MTVFGLTRFSDMRSSRMPCGVVIPLRTSLMRL
jgi:hypothetical protein